MEPTAISHRPVFGSMIVLIKRIARKSIRWYVRPQLEALRQALGNLEERTRSEASALCQNIDIHYQDLLAKLATLTNNQDAARESNERIQRQMVVRLTHLESQLARAHHQLAEIDGQRVALHASVQSQLVSVDTNFAQETADIDSRVCQLGERLGELESRWLQHDAESRDTPASETGGQTLAETAAEEAWHCRLNEVEGRLARVERHVFAIPYVNPEFGNARVAPAESFDYFEFEQKFRGPTELIKEKLNFYVSSFVGREVVIDLGCGRGEFLECLRDAGVTALGIDRDVNQLGECRRKRLSVVEAEVLSYLGCLPDQSVDGIFAAQLVEHLPFADLDRMFKLCCRKLRPGGIAIFETVNPHCTAAFKLFYLDPTHVAPLYPEVLEFFGQSAGFAKAEVIYPGKLEAEEARRECGEFAIRLEK